MPSGVSHGSASPEDSRPVFSKAIFAKSGMWLIALIVTHLAPEGRYLSIVVRMLVADDSAKLIRTVVLQRRLARQVGDPYHPSKPGFAAELLGRHHPVRAVECAGHDLDSRTVEAAEAQRCAAVGAEIALGDGGGAERGGLAAGPGEIVAVDIGKGSERGAGCLLTHPAMANADLYRGCRKRKANGAALAAAGQNNVCRRSHAHSIRR